MFSKYNKFFWIGSGILTVTLLTGSIFYMNKVGKTVEVGVAGEPLKLTADQLTGIEKVNLNTGTLEEFVALPYIGPATAQKILDYRASNGNFKKVSDIVNVKGIGPKTYEKLKKYLII